MLPIQNGLICWLEPERYNGLIWKDKTSNKYTFSTPSIKNVVDDMISFNKQSADYFLNNDINIDWNNATIQFKLKDLVDYGDSAIISLNGFEGLQISTSNALGHNKLRLNKYAGRVEIVKEIDLPNINNFVTCVFSNDFIGISIDDNEMIKKKSAIYDSKIFNKICIGNNPKLSYSPIKGKIGTILIYNRVLTEQEILHNIEYEKNKLSYVNENNLPKIVNKLSNASNIKITGNKYGNRVQTVIDKIVKKADDITKAIKQEVVNDSYSFKVGTGNVDVSADVEDGFGEVGIKGVTYQNLLGTLVAVGKKWVESDNKYTLNLPSGNGQPQIRYRLPYPLKPNTKYTLICEIKEYTTGYPHFCFMTGDNTLSASTTEFTPNTVGIHSAVLTTKSDVIAELFRILPRSSIDNTYSIGKNIVILEGDHTNNPNLPSYFEGIVGVGDRSKNLFIKEFFEWENSNINSDTGKNQDGGYTHIARTNNYMELKKGNYTISWKIIDDKYVEKVLIYDKDTNFIRSINNSANNTVKSFTVDSDSLIRLTLRDGKSSTGGTNPIPFIDAMEIQLEEGTQPTEYEKGWRGHKIEILSHGKNLINKNECKIGMFYQEGIRFPSNAHHPCVLVKVKPNTKYRINRNDNAVYIELGNTPNDYITAVNSGTPFVTTSNTNYLRIRPHKGLQQEERVYNSLEEFANSIQLEEGVDNFTNYEPYVEDKTQILLDEPLMRLPNGVCDEITRDGKLIRRIGKVLLDGSQYFNQQRVFDDRIVFGAQIDNILVDKRGDILPIADNFPCARQSGVWNGIVEGLGYSDIASGHIRVSINKSRLSPENRDGLKNFFTTNPTTLYYQLNTPTITDITPATLRIFKDGHLTFNTLVAPESNHVVQLNKSAQIERSIREVQSLDNRVGRLESFYDGMMLETNHALSLLNYDFEYTRERNGE